MKFLVQNGLFRFYQSKSDIEKVLLQSISFSVALESFRIFYTGHRLFCFLIWNLFLAIIPYVISAKLTMASKGMSQNKLLLISFGWLMFVPNSFYIITDLFHLDMNQDVPLWFDLALILSFAWSGILLGVISVRQMEKIFETHFNKKFDLPFILPVMLLNGLGVYVGRYLRFNSWDVITNPFQLITDIIYLFIHPIRNRFDWSMIICYTVLLSIIYITIKRMSKALS